MVLGGTRAAWDRDVDGASPVLVTVFSFPHCFLIVGVGPRQLGRGCCVTPQMCNQNITLAE